MNQRGNPWHRHAALLFIAGAALLLSSWSLLSVYEDAAMVGVAAGAILFLGGLVVRLDDTGPWLGTYWVVVVFVIVLTLGAFAPAAWIEAVPGSDVVPGWGMRVFLVIFLQGLAFGIWTLVRDPDSFKARRTAVAANVTILVEVGLALLVLVNVLAAGPLTRWLGSYDATATNIYSLGERTERLLDSLSEGEGTVHAVYVRLGDAGGTGEQPLEYLRKYGDYSTRVVVREFDGLRDMSDATEYLRNLGVTDPQFGANDTVVFLYREPGQDAPNRKDVEVTRWSFFETTQLGGTKFRAEQIFTSAIQDVVLPKKKVYFLTGHGEHPLKASGQNNLDAAREIIEKLSAEAESLNLGERGVMPEDADLVIVAGPKTPLLASEREILVRWLDAGGSLILMVDPDLRLLDAGAEARPPVLGEYLAGLGIAPKTDHVLMDYELTMGSSRAAILKTSQITTGDYGFHAIVEDLRDRGFRSRFPDASPVLVEEDPERTDVTTTELVYVRRSPPGVPELMTYAARLFPGRNPDQERPDRDLTNRRLPLAVAAERKLEAPADAEEGAAPPVTRVVVFGDSDFATEVGLDPQGFAFAPGNATLVTNAVSWAIGREELISIEPKTFERERVTLTERDRKKLFAVSIIVLPVLVLAFGLGVWWTRR